MDVSMTEDPRGGGARKHATMSHSNTEAEYKALVNATAKLILVEPLLRELGVKMTQIHPMV
jgi:hypothetical protein